jgi:quercetin dioxygenase-like cupin family protein
MTSTEETTATAVSVPFEVIQVIQDFAPGSWTPIHSHGGLVLVTVIEGEITGRQEATGEATVYGAGDFFIEEPGELLAAGNDGQENARVAALFLLSEGASLTTVQEGTSSDDLAPGPTTVSRTSMTITESLGNFEVVQLILDFAPESMTPLHSHGGPGLVTVIEGEVIHQPEGTVEEMVFGAGEFFTETPGGVHVAGNAGQENARLAAVFLLPEGASLTTAQEGTTSDDLPPGPTIISRTSFSVTTAAE